MDLAPVIIAAIAGTFLLAGGVKGVIGLGLPTVSLGILTAMLDLTTAMALLLVPSFVTNLWQGLVGGHALAICKRLWAFLLLAFAAVWLGGKVIAHVDLAWLSALLGLLLITYASLSLSGFRLSFSSRQERIAGPLFGAVNGVLTGMTGSFVVPGVMYLQAVGLSRDTLVQAMGILFTLSTVALAFSLRGNDLLANDQLVLSSAAVVPAIIGMVIGQTIRRRLSESTFRRVFFTAVWLLGAYILVRAVLG